MTFEISKRFPACFPVFHISEDIITDKGLSSVAKCGEHSWKCKVDRYYAQANGQVERVIQKNREIL